MYKWHIYVVYRHIKQNDLLQWHQTGIGDKTTCYLYSFFWYIPPLKKHHFKIVQKLDQNAICIAKC